MDFNTFLLNKDNFLISEIKSSKKKSEVSTNIAENIADLNNMPVTDIQNKNNQIITNIEFVNKFIEFIEKNKNYSFNENIKILKESTKIKFLDSLEIQKIESLLKSNNIDFEYKNEINFVYIENISEVPEIFNSEKINLSEKNFNSIFFIFQLIKKYFVDLEKNKNQYFQIDFIKKIKLENSSDSDKINLENLKIENNDIIIGISNIPLPKEKINNIFENLGMGLKDLFENEKTFNPGKKTSRNSEYIKDKCIKGRDIYSFLNFKVEGFSNIVFDYYIPNFFDIVRFFDSKFSYSNNIENDLVDFYEELIINFLVDPEKDNIFTKEVYITYEKNPKVPTNFYHKLFLHTSGAYSGFCISYNNSIFCFYIDTNYFNNLLNKINELSVKLKTKDFNNKIDNINKKIEETSDEIEKQNLTNELNKINTFKNEKQNQIKNFNIKILEPSFASDTSYQINKIFNLNSLDKQDKTIGLDKFIKALSDNIKRKPYRKKFIEDLINYLKETKISINKNDYNYLLMLNTDKNILNLEFVISNKLFNNLFLDYVENYSFNLLLKHILLNFKKQKDGVIDEKLLLTTEETIFGDKDRTRFRYYLTNFGKHFGEFLGGSYVYTILTSNEDNKNKFALHFPSASNEKLIDFIINVTNNNQEEKLKFSSKYNEGTKSSAAYLMSKAYNSAAAKNEMKLGDTKLNIDIDSILYNTFIYYFLYKDTFLKENNNYFNDSLFLQNLIKTNTLNFEEYSKLYESKIFENSKDTDNVFLGFILSLYYSNFISEKGDSEVTDLDFIKNKIIEVFKSVGVNLLDKNAEFIEIKKLNYNEIKNKDYFEKLFGKTILSPLVFFQAVREIFENNLLQKIKFTTNTAVKSGSNKNDLSEEAKEVFDLINIFNNYLEKLLVTLNNISNSFKNLYEDNKFNIEKANNIIKNRDTIIKNITNFILMGHFYEGAKLKFTEDLETYIEELENAKDNKKNIETLKFNKNALENFSKILENNVTLKLFFELIRKIFIAYLYYSTKNIYKKIFLENKNLEKDLGIILESLFNFRQVYLEKIEMGEELLKNYKENFLIAIKEKINNNIDNIPSENIDKYLEKIDYNSIKSFDSFSNKNLIKEVISKILDFNDDIINEILSEIIKEFINKINNITQDITFKFSIYRGRDIKINLFTFGGSSESAFKNKSVSISFGELDSGNEKKIEVN